MTILNDNLKALFGFLDHSELSLPEVINRYINYHGGLNHGHQVLLIKRLRRAAAVLDAPAAAAYHDREIVKEDGRIAAGFLERFAPTFMDAYYDVAQAQDFTRETILPASPNEWHSTELPAPFNIRLGQMTRPAVDVMFGEGHLLFVSTYGYQRFDPVAKRAWPLAASRAFPRSIEGYGQVDVDSPIAVIQDRFNDTNFAHFLYDCIPRVLHLAERFPDFARRSRFLMGGEPGDFHKLVLRWVCQQYGLSESQFVFPQGYQLWRPMEQVAFFSDQVENMTHPLHMCHEATLRMVRGLLDLRSLPFGSPDRIYISRNDAAGRRVLNEAELANALADVGYATLRLSDMDAITQIGVLARARHIVAPHGMGLTNLVFSLPGATLVELFNPDIGSDAFAFVSRALGIEYRFSVGQNREGTFLGTVVDVGHVMSLVAALDSSA